MKASGGAQRNPWKTKSVAMNSAVAQATLTGDGRQGFHSLTLIPPEALRMPPASWVQIRSFFQLLTGISDM
ncbi:MAG: hypothetical protein HY774_02195 [Acidobacteria bacterium]|nr:hypothetical protein [Acidobacteriota bacterium]